EISSLSIQTATFPSRLNFSTIASSSPFIAFPPYFLFYESRDGHDVPVVIAHRVCGIRCHHIIASGGFGCIEYHSRYDKNRIFLWCRQINNVAESLSFYWDAIDVSGIHLLHRNAGNSSRRWKCRTVRDYDSMWGEIYNFSHFYRPPLENF